MKGVDDFLFVLVKGFKDSLKKRMNLLYIVLNESDEFVRFLILKVKKQELIEIIGTIIFVVGKSLMDIVEPFSVHLRPLKRKNKNTSLATLACFSLHLKQ